MGLRVSSWWYTGLEVVLVHSRDFGFALGDTVDFELVLGDTLDFEVVLGDTSWTLSYC